MPITVDLVGQNGVPVFVKLIDMDKQMSSIKSQISNLVYLKDAVDECQRFIVGFEPLKDKQENHRIWKNVKESTLFKYIDITEKERLLEYAIENEVRPLTLDESLPS